MGSRIVRLVLVALPWAWFAVRDLAPIMEVVAVAMPLVGLVAAAAAIASTLLPPARRLIPVLVSAFVVAVVSVALPRVPDAGPVPTDTVTIASANVTGDNPNADDIVMDLADRGVDVMVLLEANPHAVRAVARLADEYPYVEVEQELGQSRVMVVSRIPLQRMTLPATLDTGRLVQVEVATPEPFTLIAAHLPRPWRTTTRTQARPADQQRLIGQVAAHVSEIEGPVLLAGDLNATDRGVAYRTLLDEGGLRDAARTGWASTTSLKWWPLLLRIDHVMTRGLCSADTSTIGLAGSDHRGLVLEVGSC